MKYLTVPAQLDKLDEVIEFINKELESVDCPIKASTAIAIAVEEIYVNIAHYAYPPVEGEAVIGCEVTPETAIITFADHGVQYNPLLAPDPDITLSADKRKIGGLGVYMVKKSMDRVSYEYKDKQNIMTIEKKLR